MGSTLRIAHNVFEKVKVEKDRKERLENYENWQKEKAKKLKALDELNEKLRDFEKIKETKSKGSNVDEDANMVHQLDTKKIELDIPSTGARRKTISTIHKDADVSIPPAVGDDFESSNTRKSSTAIHKKKIDSSMDSASNNSNNRSKSISIMQSDKQRKAGKEGWKYFRDNITLITGRKASHSSPNNPESATLSTPKCYNKKLEYSQVIESNSEPTSGSTNFECQGKKTGCGNGTFCIIL